MAEKNVFKCGVKPTGHGVNLMSTFVENNFYYYDYNQTKSFEQAKKGDLIVLHDGIKLIYVGEILIAPFYPTMINPLANGYSAEITKFFNSKISTSESSKKHMGKCVMGVVKCFYDISNLNLVHDNQMGACEISKGILHQQIISAYEEAIKL